MGWEEGFVTVEYPAERRKGQDRRAQPTRPLSLASLRGRRRHVRRAEDREIHRYVDRYDGHLVFLVIAVLLLSTTDAYLTLFIVAMGGVELNPFMAYFMERSPVNFFLVKYGLTAAGLLWLLVHKNFRILGRTVNVRTILTVIPCLYGLLVLYELFLIGRGDLFPVLFYPFFL